MLNQLLSMGMLGTSSYNLRERKSDTFVYKIIFASKISEKND